MKQVLLDLQSGGIQVEDVPVPLARRGLVVENRYSLISAGTETALINLAKKSLVGKAKDRPDDVKKVLQKVTTDGPLSAYQQAMSRLSKPEPLGTAVPGSLRRPVPTTLRSVTGSPAGVRGMPSTPSTSPFRRTSVSPSRRV